MTQKYVRGNVELRVGKKFGITDNGGFDTVGYYVYIRYKDVGTGKTKKVILAEFKTENNANAYFQDIKKIIENQATSEQAYMSGLDYRGRSYEFKFVNDAYAKDVMNPDDIPFDPNKVPY